MFHLLVLFRQWRERRQIFGEIRRQSTLQREHIYFEIKTKLTYAIAAIERGDLEYAFRIWEPLSHNYIKEVRKSPLALRVLLGLRRYDEADALMRPGLKLYPSDPSFPIALAQIAHSKEDWKEAVERWALVRKRFPGVIEGFTQGANALTAVNQLRCAEALCIRAMEQFPDAMAGYHEYARLAVREKNWQEALRRWEPLRSVFPYVGGFVGGAQALINLGRYDEADAMLRDAFGQFVNDPSPLIEYARSANARGDIGETLKRWKSLLERFPLYMHGYFDAAEAFERLNQPAEAEATLRAAVDRFETESRPLIGLAKLYHFQRLDFPAAADAWATVRKAFPDNDEAYRYGAEALERTNRHEEALALRAAYNAQFGNVEPSNGY